MLDNLQLTIKEVADDVGISFCSFQAIFFGCFRHETCGSNDCFKIAKFSAKTTWHVHRLADVNDVQRQSRYAQKGHNWAPLTFSTFQN